MPPRPAKKAAAKGQPKKRSTTRTLLIVAVALVGAYVLYRLYENYSANAAATSAGTTAGSTSPSTPSPTDTTGTTGDTTGTDQATSDLLSSLASENGQLLNGFLAGEQGLVSLLGSSVGAPTAGQTAVAEQGAAAPAQAFQAAPAPAASSGSPAQQAAAVSPGYQYANISPDVVQQSAAFEGTEGIAPGTPLVTPAPSPPVTTGAVASQSAAYSQLVEPVAPKPVNPAPSGSGAGAVAAGTAKKNYQAAKAP